MVRAGLSPRGRVEGHFTSLAATESETADILSSALMFDGGVDFKMLSAQKCAQDSPVRSSLVSLRIVFNSEFYVAICCSTSQTQAACTLI